MNLQKMYVTPLRLEISKANEKFFNLTATFRAGYGAAGAVLIFHEKYVGTVQRLVERKRNHLPAGKRGKQLDFRYRYKTCYKRNLDSHYFFVFAACYQRGTYLFFEKPLNFSVF